MVSVLSLSHRIKEQVKSRMEVLLEQEIEARLLSATTAPPPRPPQPVSRTGQTSLTASTTSRAASTTADPASSSVVVGGGTRVGTKADLVFNVDTGKFANVL